MSYNQGNDASVDESNHVMLKKISSRVLLIGIYSSTFFCCLGAILFLYKEGFNKTNWSQFDTSLTPFRSLKEAFGLIKTFDPIGIIELGLIILVLTPLLRVFFSIFIYYKQKDRLYTMISSLVFLILMIT